MFSKCACHCFEKDSFTAYAFPPSGFKPDLFLISPKDFLGLAPFLAEEQRSISRDVFNRGIPFCDLPPLTLQDDRVIDHGGRHRATVLLDNDYTTMPVRIFSVKNKDFPDYIKAQENAKDPDFTIPLPSPLTLDP